jgi:DNA-directed RNA polymerase alpha subunit
MKFTRDESFPGELSDVVLGEIENRENEVKRLTGELNRLRSVKRSLATPEKANLSVSVEMLGFSSRTTKHLKAAKIASLADIIAMSDQQWELLEAFSLTQYYEIRNRLRCFGLSSTK